MTLRYLLLVVAMAGLLASSCSGGDVAGSRCRCPTLIETAPTIDFIGDGQTPIRVETYRADKPRQLRVDLEYRVALSDEEVIEIADRFVDAGHESVTPLETPLRNSPHIVEDDWEVYLSGAWCG